MKALDIVVAREAFDITVNLCLTDIPSQPSLDPEPLSEQRSIRPSDDAIGAQAANLGRQLLDALPGQDELIRMPADVTNTLRQNEAEFSKQPANLIGLKAAVGPNREASVPLAEHELNKSGTYNSHTTSGDTIQLVQIAPAAANKARA